MRLNIKVTSLYLRQHGGARCCSLIFKLTIILKSQLRFVCVTNVVGIIYDPLQFGYFSTEGLTLFTPHLFGLVRFLDKQLAKAN